MPGRARPLKRAVLVAGERSGDQLGAALAAHLDADLHGVCGPAMQAAGVRPLASIDALSLVGLTEVVRHLPRLAGLLATLERDILALRPEVVVTIDSPSFALRLARRLKGRVRVVHWVAPQVWAWRPGRAARVAASVDALACLLPFEPALFGPVATFTGHPAAAAPRSARPEALGIAAGSRDSERARLGPVFASVAADIGLPVVEAVPPGMAPVVPGARVVPSVPAMAQEVRAALTCAGTATLELAAAGVPMVAAYQTSALTHRIARRLVRVPYLALPNLVLGRPLVPEVVQDLAPAVLRGHVEHLLGPAGDRVSDGLVEVGEILDPHGAVERVAAAVGRSPWEASVRASRR
ncbi:MAG: lipid-A-disaccharide synthase [Alphaproteobacteria bacterium]|nr:lipid-A-disaccharide synthase [Alphaproteobacteria bacterium]